MRTAFTQKFIALYFKLDSIVTGEKERKQFANYASR